MRNVLALILMACLPSMQANAQTDGKYLFDGELPVFIDSMQAELTYPMAWGNKIGRASCRERVCQYV